MRDVGIGDHGVFTHDDHGPYFPLQSGLEHFHHGEARFFWDGCGPGALELLAHRRVGEALIAGKAVGKGAHVAGPLDVVLAAEGVHARCRPAYVSREQSQIGDGQDVFRPKGMLGEPHGIKDHGPFGPTEGPRRSRQILPRYSRDLFHHFWRILFHYGCELLEAFAAFRHEFFVPKAFFQNDVAEPVDPGHVRPRPRLQVKMGFLGKLDSAGIHHDQGGPVPYRPQDLLSHDGMSFGGVGTRD